MSNHHGMYTAEHTIMARVRRIHRMRLVLAGRALKVSGLLLLSAVLCSTVSVAHVIANMPSLAAPRALMRFTLDALMHTELIVHLLIVGILIAAYLLVRDTLRTFLPLLTVRNHGSVRA